MDHKVEAAEALKLTAKDAFSFKIIDGIIKEPLGGAHLDPSQMAKTLKRSIKKEIKSFDGLSADQIIEQRINKYEQMGSVSYK